MINNLEFIDNVKETVLLQDEVLISFDVCSLFPSVPVDITLELLELWLVENKVEKELVDSIVCLTELCLKRSYFQYEGKFYQQTKGLAMGSPISPFLANLYMSFFETDLTQHQIFPRVWWRYVDDIFAVVKADSIDELFNLLNLQEPSIQFTMEKEVDGKLPFLDIEVKRIGQNLDFNIYRKPTNTDNFIPVDSFHNHNHKFAAFSSMIHRMLSVPLSEENLRKEELKIKEIARFNGFDPNIINRMIINQKRKKIVSDASTLHKLIYEIYPERIVVDYEAKVNQSLKKALKVENIEIVNKNKNKLRSLLGSVKDKTDMVDKSGIYQISCNNCDEKYIGQSRRRIVERFKEHQSHTKHKHMEKSAVALHMVENGHSFDRTGFKLLKEVRKPWFLDATESFFMSQAENLMNLEEAPINSFLFNQK